MRTEHIKSRFMERVSYTATVQFQSGWLQVHTFFKKIVIKTLKRNFPDTGKDEIV